jgi:hypothetical protein
VLAVALLVGTGVALATGTASAHSAGGPTDLALQDGPLGILDGPGGQGGDGQGGDGRNGDGQGGQRGQNGQNGDGPNGDGRNDQVGNRDQGDPGGDRNGRAGNGRGDNQVRDFGNRLLDGIRNRFSGNNRNNNRNNNQNNKNKDDVEFPGRDQAAPASDDDFVDIREVPVDDNQPRPTGDASTGSFVAHCGTNQNNHRNSDNFMVTPGKRNGAQHVHDYVGNLSTDADSTDDSLHAAGTTCDRDNKSTFFWPVVRNTAAQGDDANEDGGGKDGNLGQILRERTADIRFLGNPTTKVDEMPDDLQFIMGDAKAVTNGPKNAHAQWSCTGFENRHTDKYPLCPAGSQLVRRLEFPSCWNGKDLDSADHRSHVVFPDDDGSCDRDHVTIPKLVVTLTYDRPNGRDFAVDTFPDQKHDPATDHSDFMNIVPENLPKLEADCINSGRTC